MANDEPYERVDRALRRRQGRRRLCLEPGRRGRNYVDRAPVIWNEAGEGIFLKPVADGAPGEVYALSADGKVAVGTIGRLSGRHRRLHLDPGRTASSAFNSGAETQPTERMYVATT